MTGTAMGVTIWARAALEALRDVSRTIDGALCDAEAEAAAVDPPRPGEELRPTERVRGLREAQQLVDEMVERARDRLERTSLDDIVVPEDETS
jgi:hypothetical protein